MKRSMTMIQASSSHFVSERNGVWKEIEQKTKPYVTAVLRILCAGIQKKKSGAKSRG